MGAPFVLTYCTACHSASTLDRHGAPAEVDLETWGEVQRWLDRIEVRAVDQQTMPPSGGPPDAELATFADWLACGAPR